MDLAALGTAVNDSNASNVSSVPSGRFSVCSPSVCGDGMVGNGDLELQEKQVFSWFFLKVLIGFVFFKLLLLFFLGFLSKSKKIGIIWVVLSFTFDSNLF